MERQPTVSRKKRKAVPTTTPRTKKVISDFPISLYKETDLVAAELKMSRSAIIRRAVEELLKARRKEKLRQHIAEYFRDKVKFERGMMQHFKHVDSDLA